MRVADSHGKRENRARRAALNEKGAESGEKSLPPEAALPAAVPEISGAARLRCPRSAPPAPAPPASPSAAPRSFQTLGDDVLGQQPRLCPLFLLQAAPALDLIVNPHR